MRRNSSILLIITLLFPSCAYIDPYIQDFNVVPLATEVEVGKQMQQQIASEMKIVRNTSDNRRIQAIGDRLVQALPQKDYDYQFFVVESDVPNAFTIPGGSIYVHTGLIKFSGSEDEIAGVLAHEIGHAYEKHPAKSMSRVYSVEQIAALLFKENKGQLNTLASFLAKGGLLSKYGRNDERESDEIAYYLIKRTGYSTNGLLTFLEKLQKISNGAPVPFLSTHPPTPERITRLETLIRTDGASPQFYQRANN